MDLFNKNIQLITTILAIVSTIVVSCLWMSSKFSQLEKDIAIIKTVMIMNGHFPKELATQEK